MAWYVVQLFLLLLAAVVLGFIFGCLLRSWGQKTGATGMTTAAATGGATTVAAEASAEEKVDAEIAAKKKAMTKADADAAAKKAADAKAKAKANAAAKKAAEKEAKAKANVDAVAKKATAKEAKAKAEADVAANAADTAGEMSDEAVAARLAELPKDASQEQKADAIGSRPDGLSAPVDGNADDLKRIRGIGKVNEAKLSGLGIYHFGQIAAWSASEARWVGAFLSFMGRIEREDWIGQAKVLAEGGDTAFSKRVDEGQVASSKD